MDCIKELIAQSLAMILRGFFVTIGILLAVWLVGGSVFTVRAESIPRAAHQYKSEFIRTSRAVWGLDAPVAVFAAQIHTESWWRNDTVSQAGAQGLAQFMPSTAAWLPKVAPETGKPLPFNPAWSLRACVTYDKWLWDRVSAASAYDRMAFTLSAYNGGMGWVQRDRALAAKQGLDATRYDQMKAVNAGRRPSAWGENRAYVRLILEVRQYFYTGWGPGVRYER